MDKAEALGIAVGILDAFKEAGQIYDDYKTADGFLDAQYDEMLAKLKHWHKVEASESFEMIEVESADGLVMVELEFIDEGLSGDYSPSDPDDVPSLRYNLYRKYESHLELARIMAMCDMDAYSEGDWMQVNDASYCTRLPAHGDRKKLVEAAEWILREVEADIRELRRRKRHWEWLSWIGLDEMPNSGTKPVAEPS